MKQYSYLNALYMSFYSKKLYRDVANNWGGGTVLYLFILLLLCWSVAMVKYQAEANLTVHQFSDKIVMQMPEIILNKGQIKTPEDKPYFIKNLDDGTVFAIIDTSGTYAKENLPKNVIFLVTKNALFTYNDKQWQEQKYPANLNWDIKPVEVKDLIINFSDWLWLVLLPGGLFASFIYRLIQSVIYAGIGKVFSLLGGIELDYTKILKLTFIALTPAIILSTILDVFGVRFDFQGLVYFVFGMGYLVFALLANKNVKS